MHQKIIEKTTFPQKSCIMHIRVMGAGKSATVLIDHLQQICIKHDWQLTIGDADEQMIRKKIMLHENIHAAAVRADDDDQRSAFIAAADLVISMLPPSLHILVAKDCLRMKKHLLTASYVDDALRSMANEIKEQGLIFLCEMGLDPGIDHMSAMQLIHRIQIAGGRITEFYSHCGGLIAPESDNNPWHYKISWNPRNIVLAGKSGAVYKQHNAIVKRAYPELFANAPTITCTGIPLLEWYPNRDSLSYIPLYGLEDAETFIRTTLRYQHFCNGWYILAALGLTDTDDQELIQQCTTLQEWISKKMHIKGADTLAAYVLKTVSHNMFKITMLQLEYLALNTNDPIPNEAKCSADILQKCIEQRLGLQLTDRDMVVMLHEIRYQSADGKTHHHSASLVVKGDDHLHTAMAKTVGLPLAIAAELILTGKIKTSGLQIPTTAEIYDPVLQSLSQQGIFFTEQDVVQ